MSTDPATLAREVLDAHERHLRDDTHHGVTFPMDRDALNLHINAAPALARAVIAAATLADELSEAGRESYQEGLNDAGDAYQAATLLIHAALNGAPDA